MEIKLSAPQKYRAWDKHLNRWRDEYDWVVDPETGKPMSVHDNEYLQDEATNLILSRSTGIFDVYGKEVFEYDLVVPTKFSDVPNVVQYVGNGFYRVKMHGEKTYLNILGSCSVKIIGNIFEHPSPTVETPQNTGGNAGEGVGEQ